MFDGGVRMPREFILLSNRMKEGSAGHHLIIYPREVATSFNHLEWKVCGDLALRNSVEGTELTSFGYVHRIYMSPGRTLRMQNHKELTEAHGKKPIT